MRARARRGPRRWARSCPRSATTSRSTGPRPRRRRRSATRSAGAASTRSRRAPPTTSARSYAAGIDGRGKTIADRRLLRQRHDGARPRTSTTRRSGLPQMCGEEGVTCAPGHAEVQQSCTSRARRRRRRRPRKSNGTGQEDKSAWALEVALDVETAHAIAPGANILLVATPTAETLGVQGLQQMMNAEQYVVDNHLADVISQSFGSGEEAFGSSQSLLNLRHAFVSAQQSGVTVLASSGDGGSSNTYKEPVKKPARDPVPVGRLAGVGSARDGRRRHVPVHRPAARAPRSRARTCAGAADGAAATRATPRSAGSAPAAASATCSAARRIQNTLPAGSTPIPASQRGVPDIALQASSATTGALVYLTLPPDGNSGLICGSAPCTTGWYDIGGTSLASPAVGRPRRDRRPDQGRRTRLHEPEAVQPGRQPGRRTPVTSSTSPPATTPTPPTCRASPPRPAGIR